MSKPVVIDLCCGLGGWTRGFLAEGYDAIGFDIERHEYGDKKYPAELILKDIRQLCGYDLRAVDPVVIVASPPCQRYSYMAMPWARAKEQAAEIRANETGAALMELNMLFDACFRIARECGVPIVIENVKGAQPWVGRARAHFGSYYLWGDVESVGGRIVGRVPQFGQSLRAARRQRGVKCPGNDTFKITGAACGKLTDSRYPSRNDEGVKIGGSGDEYWRKPLEAKRREATKGYVHGRDPASNCNSKFSARKAASAMIAEIPFDLAQYIARVFKPS
jgi:hypothetical protein